MLTIITLVLLFALAVVLLALTPVVAFELRASRQRERAYRDALARSRVIIAEREATIAGYRLYVCGQPEEVIWDEPSRHVLAVGRGDRALRTLTPQSRARSSRS